MSTFAENLRQAMLEKQITQAELSKRTGISKSFISQYLSGKFKPREDKLTMLAGALGTTKGALLGYEHAKPSLRSSTDVTEVEVFSADEPEKPWGSEKVACEPGEYRFYICRDDKNRPFVMFGDMLLVSVNEIGGAGLYAVLRAEQGGKVFFREFSDPRKEAAEQDLKIIGRVCELRRKF